MLDAREAAESVKLERGARSGRRNARTGGRTRAAASRGLHFSRVFSPAGVDPFDTVEWDRRKATIADEKGAVLFEQDDVQVPKNWSMLATNVVASKYFYGELGSPARESSVRQLIHRVARTIADWGLHDGVLATAEDAETFYRELVWLCLHQYGSFNSPVWFNCGLYHQYGIGRGNSAGLFYFDREAGEPLRAPTQYEHPQCSACFIQSVDDTMEGIMSLAASEAMLFKFGSGTGSDLSTLRSTRERLSGGGRPSGPLSFLKVYDSIASVVKSGGKTRRAAKMNTLKIHHPDIREFIEAKLREEKKAWALIAQGYDGDFNGEAYGSVCFQNENLSVRVTDEFMQAVIEDREWKTHWVTDPSKEGPTYRARDLLRWMAEGAWTCGDPGIQYEDTIQRWHTCSRTAPIHSSNPCSEFMFLDDSSCNLASLNLLKFLREDGTFDVKRLRAAAAVFITAQEILVDNASYPTAAITLNSHRFRPLGLGYANLGALLMALGLPYDSDQGRGMAAAVTAALHFAAYEQSARLAGVLGPFDGFAENREPMEAILRQHRAAMAHMPPGAPDRLIHAVHALADDALALGQRHGYRNAQVTVLAPTGTIGFMMDCDTTGVEPDIAIVKYKLLAGGGMLKLVNRTVPEALRRLGYTTPQVESMVEYIGLNDTIENAPGLRAEDLPVFDCAFKPRNGQRFIPYQGHIKMMAAVQPFLSGAISKTVNLPNEASVDEIVQAYLDAWKLGLKALAVYRDGCKRSQPVNVAPAAGATTSEESAGNGSKARPLRRRMPNTRQSVTHKFDIAGHEGYLTVGLYDDHNPGELFITMAKEGSTIGGLMDSFGTAISLCLQYGVPLNTLVEKFAHSRFEPSGFTKNPTIPIAKSVTDYIFRWLGQTFLEGQKNKVPTPATPPQSQSKAPAAAPAAPSTQTRQVMDVKVLDDQFKDFMEDAPACDQCGAITVRNGACYRCYNCGNSMGCS